MGEELVGRDEFDRQLEMEMEMELQLELELQSTAQRP